ncbi:hypothetical protein NMY22_g8799 [Coprinellus aureogranulatus]|nr:hypothetical protein NMY22_g8799 [Coprinellus aureogranulatus]
MDAPQPPPPFPAAKGKEPATVEDEDGFVDVGDATQVEGDLLLEDTPAPPKKPGLARPKGTPSLLGSRANSPAGSRGPSERLKKAELEKKKKAEEDAELKKKKAEEEKEKKARREQEKKERAALRAAELKAQQAQLEKIRREGEEALRQQKEAYEAEMKEREAEMEKLRMEVEKGMLDDEADKPRKRKCFDDVYGSDVEMEVDRPSWHTRDRTMHPDFDDRFIETMELHQKLIINSAYEQENDERYRACMVGRGSIDDFQLQESLPYTQDEWESLCIPAFWDTVKMDAPRSLAKEVLSYHAKKAEKERQREEEKKEADRREGKGKKRAREVRSDDESETEGPDSKRPIWEMREEDERVYEAYTRVVPVIPTIFLTTETHLGFPLNWCSNDNFDWLCANWSRLPHRIVRVPDPQTGASKASTCIDVDIVVHHPEKMSAALADETLLLRAIQPPNTAMFWEAAENYTALQTLRDPRGKSFNRDWTVKHFEMWRRRPGLSNPAFFSVWIEEELRERTDRRSRRETLSESAVAASNEGMTKIGSKSRREEAGDAVP